jgi:hypothetical protein
MTIDLLSMASIIVIFQSFLMAAFLALNKKIANQQPYARLFTPCICRDSGPHTAHKQSSFLCNNCAAAKNHFRLRAIRLFSRTSIVFLHQDSSFSNFSFQKNGLDSFCSLCLSRMRSNFIERTMEPFTLWMYPGRIYMSGAIVPQTILYLTASSKNLQSFGLT